jgi:hypothetical protein
MKSTASAFVLMLTLMFTLAAASLRAQGSPITENMGGSYKDPVQRSADCYSRGARARAKAEKETDPQKKAKLYAKAKQEFSKAVGYHENYDALLGLGQVYLVLGQKPSALDACARAQSFKPHDPVAKACMDEASRKEDALAAEPAPGGQG